MVCAALAHLAHARAAAATGVGGAPNTAAYTQLATKLESLINTCLQPNILPDIARRVHFTPQSASCISGWCVVLLHVTTVHKMILCGWHCHAWHFHSYMYIQHYIWDCMHMYMNVMSWTSLNRYNPLHNLTGAYYDVRHSFV